MLVASAAYLGNRDGARLMLPVIMICGFSKPQILRLWYHKLFFMQLLLLPIPC